MRRENRLSLWWFRCLPKRQRIVRNGQEHCYQDCYDTESIRRNSHSLPTFRDGLRKSDPYTHSKRPNFRFKYLDTATANLCQI